MRRHCPSSEERCWQQRDCGEINWLVGKVAGRSVRVHGGPALW